MSADSLSPPVLTRAGRWTMLVVAVLGWLCAGMCLAVTSLAMKPAAVDLLGATQQLSKAEFAEFNKQSIKEKKESTKLLSDSERAQLQQWNELVARWFAWLNCGFLFGAAMGGLLLGRVGDQIGRSKGMALSILTYSSMSAAAYFTQTPSQLLVFWFLAGLGVGGMWPNGVALVSEAWSNMSRGMSSGLIGTAANVGIFALSTYTKDVHPITPDDWRWVLLITASPLVLGFFSLVAVPESPRWLASRNIIPESMTTAPANSQWEVFRPPFLSTTLIAIALATIPLIGGWGSANWMIPWADSASTNPALKSAVNQARSFTGIIGSLIGGWVAGFVGRKSSYFLVSLIALAIAQYTFWFVVPADASFLYWVAALGFFSGIYFGWLPLFLPELFPTRVRSTGAGVGFNFGRVLTAATIFVTGALMEFFKGDFAAIGRVTSLIYAFGMLAILAAPDTSRKQLTD